MAAQGFAIRGRSRTSGARADPARSAGSARVSSVTRAQLEHIIRAACAVADDSEVVVVGSQAILGQFPLAPRSSCNLGIGPPHAGTRSRVRAARWRGASAALGLRWRRDGPYAAPVSLSAPKKAGSDSTRISGPDDAARRAFGGRPTRVREERAVGGASGYDWVSGRLRQEPWNPKHPKPSRRRAATIRRSFM